MPELCDFCNERIGTLQVMYPTFNMEKPDLLLPCCATCAKGGEDPKSDIVIPTEEELLLISLGYEVTNEKIERIREEGQRVIEEFIAQCQEKGITLKPLEEEPPV